MLVIDAVRQARLVAGWMSQLASEELNRTASSLEVVEVYLVQIQGVEDPPPSAMDTMRAFARLNRDGPQVANLVASAPDDLHPVLMHRVGMAKEALTQLSANISEERLASLFGSLAEPARGPRRLAAAGSARAAIRSSYLAKQILEDLKIFVDAWLAFDTPTEMEPTTHSIALHAATDEPTLDYWRRLIEGIDGAIVAALAGSGQLDRMRDVRIERIEAGSFGLSLPKLPEPVWKAIAGFFGRGLDREGYELEKTLTLARGAAEINALLADGKITKKVHRELMGRMAKASNLDLWPDDAPVLVIDGEVVGEASAAKALREPDIQRALPAGPAQKPVTDDEEDDQDDQAAS